MLSLSVSLNCIVALGLVYFGLRYFAGPVPAGYHAQMLAQQQISVEGPLARVMAALYRSLGACFLALAVAVACLALIAQRHGALWAAVTILVMTLIVGCTTAVVAYRAEAATGIHAPWRPAIVLTCVGLVAFVLFLP